MPKYDSWRKSYTEYKDRNVLNFKPIDTQTGMKSVHSVYRIK